MPLSSINPFTETLVEQFDDHNQQWVEQPLAAAASAARNWAATPIAERSALLSGLAARLRADADQLATLITREMGKLRTEARAEIDKCAWVCDYYAERAAEFLADEPVASDAQRSLVAYQPLGPWLAIMPWNFPFWQVFRCAAPALAAGNPVLLKHASNVTGCALAIERLFAQIGAPAGLFQTLLIAGERAEAVVAVGARARRLRCVRGARRCRDRAGRIDGGEGALPERRPELHRRQALHRRARDR
jgi:succinate-semialdehyde dehydrogenase/glutarate-semialdehyde dehydrogenase